MPYHYLPPVPVTPNDWQPPEETAPLGRCSAVFSARKPSVPRASPTQQLRCDLLVWAHPMAPTTPVPPFTNAPRTSV